VFEVVYEIDTNERITRDCGEGPGDRYGRKYANLNLSEDNVTVSIYFATKVDPVLIHYTWYNALVVAGAKEHGLPEPCIASLEAVEASEDFDRTRHDRNMRIVSAAGHLDGAQA
jgi:hypothetical protein